MEHIMPIIILSDLLFSDLDPDRGITSEIVGKPAICHALDQYVGKGFTTIHL